MLQLRQSTPSSDTLPSHSSNGELLTNKIDGDADAHATRPDGTNPAQLRPSLTCGVLDCSITFKREYERDRHQIFPHTGRHSVVSESPFICKCDQQFARLDTLLRHIRRFQDLPSGFHCEDCKKGFKRKDHLVQHLRHFHRLQDAEIVIQFPTRKIVKNVIPVCHFTSCDHYRDDSFTAQPLKIQEEIAPFAKKSDYTEHMRKVHKWSPYPCTIPLCDKVDKNGYFNEKALQKHILEKHPDEEPLVIQPREVENIPCGALGCTKKLRPSSLSKHRESYCKFRLVRR